MSSYQVFARKYRPQTFDSVVGQQHITQTLKNAIATDRLAHAYLFVGPRGTGKTSTARILAKALNCVHGPTIDPCGECDVCREIAAGNSLDVLEIDGASNNGVEQVRELRENVRFAPTRGKYKVYIIDEVHMLTTAAFNALLKTLEEPPEHVKFIFATTDVQKVLPTILSRCQRFDLRRIPAELIAGHLEYIAGEERIALEHDAARAIAKGAEGGLRDAESMLDQLVAFCGEKITQDDVLSVFGFTASQTVSSLCDHLLDENSPAALGVVQEQAEAGRDLSRLMADLIGHLRNLLVAKADPEGIKAEVGGDELAILQEQAELIPLDRLLDLIEQFAAAEGRMKWAPNKKLHFEIAVIKAIQTLGQATLTEVLDTLTAIRTGGELPPAVTKKERPARLPRPERTAPDARAAQPAPAAPPAARPAPVKAEPAPEPPPEPEPQARPEPESVTVPQPPPAASPAPVSEPPPQPAKPARAEPPRPVPAAPVEELLPVTRETVSLSLSFDEADEPAAPKKSSEKSSERPPEPSSRESRPLAPWEDRPKPGLETREPAKPEAQPEPPPAFSEPDAWRHPQEVDPAPAVPDFADEPQPPSRASRPPDEAPRADSGDSTDLGDLWYRLIGEVRDKKPLLRAWVETGLLLRIENGACILGFPEDQRFSRESLEKPVPRRFLEETLSRLAGQPLAVRFEERAGLKVEPVVLPEKVQPAAADPMEEFKNDPVIRRALELFRAEIQ